MVLYFDYFQTCKIKVRKVLSERGYSCTLHSRRHYVYKCSVGFCGDPTVICETKEKKRLRDATDKVENNQDIDAHRD